ncbi:uncharacterized protein LOC126668671 [Mercurialis annua]|uniref:uncharacterized protein LOC126668671 n=1 Tax=Mercurialis annua TaxID=3986 RepID=UPI00216014F9|nr:uncharacterized protein LOC126668671 [Mercurialis annua]
MIQTHFHQEDALKILSIPLPYWPYNDKLVWHYHSQGKYTVKSGYYIALNSGYKPYQSLIPQLQKPDWKLLWNLKIPNKIKVFIWKCLHEGLPTGIALQHRLNYTSSCCFCDQQETLIHMLFTCPRAKQIWFISPLHYKASVLPSQFFYQMWLQTVTDLQELDGDDFYIHLFCYLLWNIWKSRNAKIFQQNHLSSEDIISICLREFEEFKLSQQENNPTSQHTVLVNTTLQTTSGIPQGFIKINYDAAVDTKGKNGFIGAVAVNWQLQRKGKFSATFRYIWDPGILEMLALREALNWAISKGWTNVIFEGDALQVSNIINTRNCTNGAYQGICEDIWRLLRSFTMARVLYTQRKNNEEAHKWAQQVKRLFRTPRP